MNCRNCGAELSDVFLDLISAPPSNTFLKEDDLSKPELWHPLKVFLCHKCFLVQVPEHAAPAEIFNNNYAYFSSYSTSWLRHAATYAAMIKERLNLGPKSHVVEIASNDGYLLRNFVAQGIPCLGIEPSANTAAVARNAGIETWGEFFTKCLALRLVKDRGAADLIIGNNVLAHVPDINDFVAGIATALAPHGTATLEFPHLLEMIKQTQFDTVYHEHYSYLSLIVATQICEAQNLRIYDADKIPTHGGSLRIFLCHGEAPQQTTESVARILQQEHEAQLDRKAGYKRFAQDVARLRDDFLNFLLRCRRENATVLGYGAAAKGNTLLNFSGIRGTDAISCVVDRSPHKIGKFLPGSHIPVVNEAEIHRLKPAYVLILPWNLSDEIMNQLNYIAEWGGRFVRVVPRLEVLDPPPHLR